MEVEVSRRFSVRSCFSEFNDFVPPQPTYPYGAWHDPPAVSRTVQEPHISRRDFDVRLQAEHKNNDSRSSDMCVTSPVMSADKAATDTAMFSETSVEDTARSPTAETDDKTAPTSARKGKKKPYRRHAKPPVSYTAMIAAVIQESPEKKLTLLQIVDELKKRYSFFNGDYKGWKNSVRHNLSLNKCFVKVPRDADRPFGKDNFWTVDGIESYLNPDGTFRQRRKRAQPGTATTRKAVRSDSEEPKKQTKGKRLLRADRSRHDSSEAEDSRTEPKIDEEGDRKETEQQTSKSTQDEEKIRKETPKTEKFRGPYAIESLLSPRDVTDGPDHSPVLFYLSPRYTHRPTPEQQGETAMDVDSPSSDDSKSPENILCDESNREADKPVPKNDAPATTSASETPMHVQQTFPQDMSPAETHAQPQGQATYGNARSDQTPVRTDDATHAPPPGEDAAHVVSHLHQFGSHVSGPPPPLYRQPSPPWSYRASPPNDRYSSWEGGADSTFPSFRSSFHPSPAVVPSSPWLAHPDRSIHSPYGFDLPSLRSWASPGSAVWPSPTWSPTGGGMSPVINFTGPLTDPRFSSTPYPPPHSFSDRSNTSSLSDYSSSHPPVVPQHGHIPPPTAEGMAPKTAESAHCSFSYCPPMATQAHQSVRPFTGCSNTRPDFRPPTRPSMAFGSGGPPSPRVPGVNSPFMLPARSLHLIEPVPRHLSYVYHSASANCTCTLCVEAHRAWSK
ncbi:uncharacterized protein LOC144879875 [Branchiostoma floridae x Branchiostoma japonicum]